MKNETRVAFNRIVDHIAKLNGVPTATSQFTVEPTIQQRLEDKIQESADFLPLIGTHVVDELKGETLQMGSSPIASNTKTSKDNRRWGRDPTNIDAQDYECKKNDFDVRYGYSKLDMWAKFPDFAARLFGFNVKQQARDIQMIGFNGVKYSENTDINQYPMLQDVNVGWLQKVRMMGAKYHINGVKVGAKVSKADGFKNIDALVMDAVNSIIAPWYRSDADLRVLCSFQTLAKKYFDLINQAHMPTDQVATKQLMMSRDLGGYQPLAPSFFPENTIMITIPAYMSRYVQKGGRRRHLKEETEYNSVADYQSSNDAYCIEDPDCVVLIDNITFEDD